jgi:hypothetical protein
MTHLRRRMQEDRRLRNFTSGDSSAPELMLAISGGAGEV